MKRNFLLCMIALPIILFYSCNNTPQQPVSKNDSATYQPRRDGDTTRRIVFVNTKDKGFNDSVRSSYEEAGFITYDKADFYKYFDYFTKIFKIGQNEEFIKGFKPFPFSIHEMYNGMQKDLFIRDKTTDIGIVPDVITHTNIFRIYPAIDDSKKEFYLVLLKEQQPPGKPKHTDLAVDYYSIRGDVLGKHPDKTAAEKDIKNFQAVWAKIVTAKDPAHPTFTFAPCRSFSYSVAFYDQLLSSKAPFWGLDKAKTDATLKDRTIMLVPIIDYKDETYVQLRLVALAHRKAGSYYNLEYGLEYFDNMYPCPSQCPDNEIK